jgi:hypothetical protein
MPQRTKWDTVAEIISVAVVVFALLAFPGLVVMFAISK